MTKKYNVDFTVENRLILAQRDMNVYHHFTGKAHMVGFNHSITLPLRTEIENDFLHISVVQGPGFLDKQSVIDLPSWIDFELTTLGKIIVSRCSGRTFLKIPPGLPIWQLKMIRPFTGRPVSTPARVTVTN